MNRVVVTGIGIVSPNGNSREEVWENVSNLNCGIKKSNLPNANFVGMVNEDFNKSLTTKEKRYMNRCTQLALLASKEAIEDANICMDNNNSEDISVLVGSSVGGISSLAEEFGESALNGLNEMSMLVIPRALINMIPANISIRLGIKGETIAYSNACASGTVAIGEAFKKIQHGERSLIIAGGSEACVIPEVLEPFRKLKALTNSNTLNNASIPFSSKRSGFVMSEGSAMLVLENYQHAIDRGANIYCEIFGYGSSSDAKSLLAPDLEGVKRCIKNTINDANIDYNEIEYINAHGTSTKLNDSTETKAISDLFSHRPFISSTKSLHGHALGAAGAIEAALCGMMIKNSLLIPTINVDHNDIDFEEPLNFLLQKPVPYKNGKILSNSFAFGGHNASLVFGKERGLI
ncbi:beta-ketoacyl-[acyl-carrier-protein] synthase family protein [Bacillus sp. FSL K6-1003]|uniref:beta-ketoacyl-[acyl-carrier-protein] synthase family protein n=1 Tax=Bacillus sp. FSL K6-1003 TaxID=2954675 RepID=UPI0030D1F547